MKEVSNNGGTNTPEDIENPSKGILGGNSGQQEANSTTRGKGRPVGGGTNTELVREMRQKKILEAVAKGLNFNAACRASGTPVSTGKRWLVEYPDFRLQVEYEKSHLIEDLMGTAIKLANKGNSNMLVSLLKGLEGSPLNQTPTVSEEELEVLSRIIELMVNQSLLPIGTSLDSLPSLTKGNPVISGVSI